MDTANPKEKECLQCSKSFQNFRINKRGQRIGKFTLVEWAQARFCSRACSREYRKAHSIFHSTKHCDGCGSPYRRGARLDAQWAKSRYCSLPCLHISRIGAKRDPSSFLRGPAHPNWKGGLTTENAKIRNSRAYKRWRKSVFERDKYTCVWCGQVGGSLEADHIKPFALHPELRLAISNGRTLCVPCHKKTDTYCGRVQPKKIYG